MTISPQQISQLESRIGVELPPVSYDIEKGLIRRFAQAVGDDNPLWQDEEYAKEIGYQSLVAPPNLILTLGFDQVLAEFIADDALTVLPAAPSWCATRRCRRAMSSPPAPKSSTCASARARRGLPPSSPSR